MLAELGAYVAAGTYICRSGVSNYKQEVPEKENQVAHSWRNLSLYSILLKIHMQIRMYLGGFQTDPEFWELIKYFF